MTEKLVEYRVLLTVEDNGCFDSSALKDAVSAAIDTAYNEGDLTDDDDETTIVKSWNVSHVSTKEA